MQFDVYVPALSLGFEYQGEQHYNWHFFYGSSKDLSQRDQDKRTAARQAGITLIEIPYWWDQRLATLQATIHKIRPDLIPNPGLASPIPTEEPIRKLRASGIPVIYLLATPLPWLRAIDPTDW
jgi:hypothetical protein